LASLRYLVRFGCSAYEYCVFYFGYLYFGAGCAFVSFISTLLRPLLPGRVGMRLGRSMTSAHCRGFLAFLRGTGLVRMDLAALDELRNEHSIIVAPNHPSLLDAVFVISRLPQIACVLKSELWDSLFLGGTARLSGYIRNDVPVSLIRQSAAELRTGQQLLLFPEGTRTRDPPVNAFKGGVALIAKHSRARVQTVLIEANSAFLSKGWPLFHKPDFPLIYRARLGRRFHVEGNAKAFLSELETYYRYELTDLRDIPRSDPHIA
jgi:1-acyl-sn-glycerol-3-phosphate acyltransferase